MHAAWCGGMTKAVKGPGVAKTAPEIATSRQQGHGRGGDALLTTLETQVLGGGCLHANVVDRDAHGGCQVLAHLLAMWRHLRRLSCDDAIDVDDLVALFAHLGRHRRQQLHGIGPLPFGIGVGEELADVAAADGAEQRIRHGMRQHIGVGVAEQPQGVRDIHPADDELAALDQLMHVVALPYAQGAESQAHCSCSPFCLR